MKPCAKSQEPMTLTSSWKIVGGLVSRTDLLQPSARRYRGARPCSACGAFGHNIRTCKDARAVKCVDEIPRAAPVRSRHPTE